MKDYHKTDPRTVEEIDTLADRIQNSLVTAYEKACPIRKHKAGKSVPYYTSDDRKQRTIVRRTFNKCKKSKNWELYYKELRIYSSNLRRRGRIGWQNQCSSISSVHDSAKMFKILSKDPSQSVGSLLLPSGEYTKDQYETYKHLLDIHFPNCKLINGTDTNQLQVEAEGIINNPLIDKIIT